METVRKIHVELDYPASQISTVCLGTPVIIRQILQQFSNSELLKLSFVNKQWNFEARSVLRNRGTLTVRIPSDKPTCQSLAALASDLRRMRVVPFSGVHFRLSHSGYDACKSNASLDLSYKVILELLPWKNLSVDFHDNLANCKDCPALALVMEALKRSCGLLERVSLTFQRQEVELFQHVNAVLNRSSFPRLKLLKLDLDNTDGRLTESAKALASRAPKLQQLQIMRSMDFEENLLGGRSSTVVVPWPRFNPLYERVCPGLISTLSRDGHPHSLMGLEVDE